MRAIASPGVRAKKCPSLRGGGGWSGDWTSKSLSVGASVTFVGTGNSGRPYGIHNTTEARAEGRGGRGGTYCSQHVTPPSYNSKRPGSGGLRTERCQVNTSTKTLEFASSIFAGSSKNHTRPYLLIFYISFYQKYQESNAFLQAHVYLFSYDKNLMFFGTKNCKEINYKINSVSKCTNRRAKQSEGLLVGGYNRLLFVVRTSRQNRSRSW